MRRLRPTLLLLTLGVVLASPPAGAQPADAMERARKAFAEGAEAEGRNDCVTAIQRFEEVVSVKETPAVRLRIGRCNEKLGKLLAAQRDYERAKELAATEPQALEVATQVAADLAKRIPRIEIRLVGAPESTVVKVDGAPLPPDTQTKTVDPGRHRVTAEAEGHEGFDESFDLAEGAARSLTVTLRALKDPGEPPPPPPLDEEEAPFPWLPVALYGGGAIAIGVGIPLLITSLSDDADLDEKCFDETGAISADRKPCLQENGARYAKSEQQEITSDRESIITRQIVGWSLIGVGAAAAGVATVLLVTEGSGGDDASAMTTSPVVGPGYAGWSAAGRF